MKPYEVTLYEVWFLLLIFVTCVNKYIYHVFLSSLVYVIIIIYIYYWGEANLCTLIVWSRLASWPS